jgi:heat shock protein HtpX
MNAFKTVFLTAHLFIINPLTQSRLMNLFSTYPTIEDRIKRLLDIDAGKR